MYYLSYLGYPIFGGANTKLWTFVTFFQLKLYKPCIAIANEGKESPYTVFKSFLFSVKLLHSEK